MAMLSQFLHVLQNIENFHDRFGPGPSDDVIALILLGFEL